MLCAKSLAALENATPIEQRCIPPTDETVSSTTSSAPELDSTVSTVSPDRVVGVPRDFSGHADGTSKAYDSIEKWVLAALKHLGKDKTDLVFPSLQPNNELCSMVHSTIADWHTSHTTGQEAGVTDHRPSVLEKPPPQESVLSKLEVGCFDTSIKLAVVSVLCQQIGDVISVVDEQTLVQSTRRSRSKRQSPVSSIITSMMSRQLRRSS